MLPARPCAHRRFAVHVTVGPTGSTASMSPGFAIVRAWPGSFLSMLSSFPHWRLTGPSVLQRPAVDGRVQTAEGLKLGLYRPTYSAVIGIWGSEEGEGRRIRKVRGETVRIGRGIIGTPARRALRAATAA